MRTGAAYIRVSTEEQTEFSPDSQISRIREYAKGHDIILPEENIYMDMGISGRTASKRPAFLRMIGEAKRKPAPFDIILVWKFSRFARNRQDSILYKSMLRKECGIEVVSITEQLSGDPTAILIEALLEAMDEYYSINLAQEVRRGMNEKFSRGGVVSIPPFGYKMGKGRFVPDEENAPFVRMIFQDYLDGMSCRAIAAKLNRMRVYTGRGGPFESRGVEYILTNPVYLGKQRRNLVEKDKNDRFHLGEEVTVVPGRHEALIPQEMFQEAARRREIQRRVYPRRAGEGMSVFMLKGLVRCSSCGATLTLAVKGKSLQCHRYAKGLCNESHSVTLEKLNRAVSDALEADIRSLAMENRRVVVKPPVIRDKPTEAGGALLEKEKKRLIRVKQAYEAGADSLEEYIRNKTGIEERIGILERQDMDGLPEWSAGKAGKAGKGCMLTLGDIPAILKSPETGETFKNTILRCILSHIIFSRRDSAVRLVYKL